VRRVFRADEDDCAVPHRERFRALRRITLHCQDGAAKVDRVGRHLRSLGVMSPAATTAEDRPQSDVSLLSVSPGIDVLP
jgi:hypothetical protein